MIAKESYLSVSHLEAIAKKRIPTVLRNQYKIDNSVKDGEYMTCKSCYTHVAYTKKEKPPKFAISNGWLIGEIPRSIIGNDISDILASSVAKICIFRNVFSYSAGAHKII